MATHQFAFEPGGPKRVVITHGFAWKNTRVAVDGQEIGAFADFAALRHGGAFALPDGTQMHVQFVQSLGGAELRVLRNGQPLPGSGSDPATQVRQVAGVVYGIGGLSIAVGLIGSLGVEFLRRLGFGWPAVAEGLVFVVLGYFTSRRSRVALGLAIGLFVLDALASLVASSEAGGTLSFGPIGVRVVLVLAMARGFKAMGAAPPAPVSPPQVYR